MTQTIAIDAAQKKQQTNAMLLIGMLFFIFGFVTWLNSTLIPFLKIACELQNYTQAFLVTSAFYIAYFIIALPSSYILRKTGYKKGMAIGLCILALGTLIFIPAANIRSFTLFLSGLFIQATGLALLQTATNPYISILGPIESAARRISIMGICNKMAGIISPLIIGTIILKDGADLENKINAATSVTAKQVLLNDLAGRVILPYLIMAILIFFIAFIIQRSTLPEIDFQDKVVHANSKKKESLLQFPHLWLGVVCIFLYVGAEVMAGDAIGIYGQAIGISLDKTKYFASFTLTAMLTGYVIGIFTIPKLISQQNALMVSAILGIVFTCCIFFTSGYTSITFIALLGLANALMWPAIFPLAIEGLGRFTKIGSAFLIMGIVGGALIPPVYSALKDMPAIGNSLAFFICMLPCYLYILYYALAGYKRR